MSATATHPCYTCGEPIPPSQHRFVATFEGQQRDLCEPCAFGIRCGTEVLTREGVTGEFLGPCGDNQPQPPAP